MKDLLEKGLALHNLYVGTPVDKFNLEENVIELRERLITEEYREVMAELLKCNDDFFGPREKITNLIMELADLVVVTIGTVVQMGLSDEFETAYDLIFERNMAKAVNKETALAMVNEEEGRRIVQVDTDKYLVKDAWGKVIKPKGLKDVKPIILKMVEEKINKR